MLLVARAVFALFVVGIVLAVVLDPGVDGVTGLKPDDDSMFSLNCVLLWQAVTPTNKAEASTIDLNGVMISPKINFPLSSPSRSIALTRRPASPTSHPL